MPEPLRIPRESLQSLATAVELGGHQIARTATHARQSIPSLEAMARSATTPTESREVLQQMILGCRWLVESADTVATGLKEFHEGVMEILNANE